MVLISIESFESEFDLLQGYFLKYWIGVKPTVITGWNIRSF